MCKAFEVGTDEQDIYNVINYISATKTAKPLELVLEKPSVPCSEMRETERKSP